MDNVEICFQEERLILLSTQSVLLRQFSLMSLENNRNNNHLSLHHGFIGSFSSFLISLFLTKKSLKLSLCTANIGIPLLYRFIEWSVLGRPNEKRRIYILYHKSCWWGEREGRILQGENSSLSNYFEECLKYNEFQV